MNLRGLIDSLLSFAKPDFYGAGTSAGAKKAWEVRHGQFTGKQKLDLRHKGMMVSMRKPLEKLDIPITKNAILDKSRKVVPGVKHIPYTTPSPDKEYFHTILKPYGIPVDGPHGAVWSAAPPDKEHSEKGQFYEHFKMNKERQNSVTAVFDSRPNARGMGTTLFVNKERTGPASARVGLVEVTHDSTNHIMSTKAKAFTSGKQARDFMRMRYGIDPKLGTTYQPRSHNVNASGTSDGAKKAWEGRSKDRVDHYSKGFKAADKLPDKVKQNPTSYQYKVDDKARNYRLNLENAHPSAESEYRHGMEDRLSNANVRHAAFEWTETGKYPEKDAKSPIFKSETLARHWIEDSGDSDKHVVRSIR